MGASHARLRARVPLRNTSGSRIMSLESRADGVPSVVLPAQADFHRDPFARETNCADPARRRTIRGLPRKLFWQEGASRDVRMASPLLFGHDRTAASPAFCAASYRVEERNTPPVAAPRRVAW